MAEVENQIRKAHKSSSGTDRLVNAARLAALEKNIGVKVKRHRDPIGDISVSASSLEPDQDKISEDETVFLGRES